MFNFPRFASEHGVPYLSSGHHHCHEGWLQTHCPNCTDGKHGYHLGYSLVKGNLNCWRCGYVRTVDAIAAWLRVPRGTAFDIYRRYSDGRPEGRRAPIVRVKKCPPPPDLGRLRKPHRTYLRARRFDPDELEAEWSLGGTGPLGGRWKWRVVFPICSDRGDTVAWCGRSIFDVKPKYRMTEDAKCLEDPRTFLYGIHKVAGDAVIVVEGPADVWRIGPGAVGLLGIDWKQEQANKLRHYRRRYIMFDPDQRAKKRAQQLAEWLSLYPGVTEVIEGLKTDPGDMSAKEARRLRKELLGVVP